MTPLLKRLQEKGYIERSKDPADERNLVITLTKAGRDLQDQALSVPECMAKEVHITEEEAGLLYRILYKIIDDDKETQKTEKQNEIRR